MAVIGWKLINPEDLKRIVLDYLSRTNQFEMTHEGMSASIKLEPINLEPDQMQAQVRALAGNEKPPFEMPPEDERTQMQVLNKFLAALDCKVEICPWNPRNLLFTKMEAKCANKT